jgi:hypothetical protein
MASSAAAASRGQERLAERMNIQAIDRKLPEAQQDLLIAMIILNLS